MAAANGTLKTILALIILFLVMCAVGLYLLMVVSKTAAPNRLLERAPISMGTHDHRVDRWTHIDLA